MKIGFLYHLTKEKNLNSILQSGLKINTNKFGFVRKSYKEYYFKKYDMQPIFLTTDVDYCIEKYLTKKFIKLNRCHFLKIKNDNLELEDEVQYLIDRWKDWDGSLSEATKNFEKFKGINFICRSNIDKNLIIDFGRIKI